ncbi:Flp family type IVb pilin [Vampirovibrio chlorellavorus]|uniref:Flp family type IVb pilin n=1 Tax=Vampirovibrio chlorellavorus TaxID=758823 RepID=UPI0026F0843E|nr:Flp family type IVb pilin [Vampirovibrio chlorellavorus]
MLKHYISFQVWLATHKNGKSKGQSLAEYGLILALIAVFCIMALTTLGGSISKMLTELGATIGNVNTGG